MRRPISSVSASLKAAGARRSALSIDSMTSAWLRAGRVAAPAKITSSMPPPRIAVGRFSPITQRSASKRFDLPQPFGPTTPVSPSSITRSVGSTKLLKPFSRSRENRMKAALVRALGRAPMRERGARSQRARPFARGVPPRLLGRAVPRAPALALDAGRRRGAETKGKVPRCGAKRPRGGNRECGRGRSSQEAPSRSRPRDCKR